MTLQELAEELDMELEKVLDRVAGNEALLIRLLGTYAQAKDMGEAEEAFAGKDYETLEKAVHSMKGAAATLEMTDMAQAAHALVQALRQNRYEDVSALFEQVRREYDRVCEKVALLEM